MAEHMRRRTGSGAGAAAENAPASGEARHETLERRAADRTGGYAEALNLRGRGPAPVQGRAAPNRTGLPDRLKTGIEALSGLSLDDVQVHYNSSRPAQLDAHAYAQGPEIHVGPGQERHLPHEAWHVVQQKQGRVRPTVQLKGIPANEDSSLEREADRMGQLALGIGPGLGAPTLSGLGADHGGGCGCGACGGAKAAAPSPVATAAQFCRKDPSCPNKDPCPVHEAYSQRQDPSIFGPGAFFSAASSFELMGQSALEKQRTGGKSSSDDVRVKSGKRGFQRGGAGADEALPTDQRDKVAASGSAAQRGAQSGLRGATDKTILKAPGKPASGHTNAFPKASGAGSTHTKHQKAAHDARRSIPKGTHPEQAFGIASSYVSTLATGKDILSSDAITGALPNRVGASALGPPAATGTTAAPDAERILTAQIQNESREKMKQRLSTLATHLGQPRPVSPERGPIDADGSGGSPLQPGEDGRPSSPMPYIDATSGSDTWYAQTTAWTSGPMRHHAPAEHLPLDCSKCGAKNAAYDVGCRACEAVLPVRTGQKPKPPTPTPATALPPTGAASLGASLSQPPLFPGLFPSSSPPVQQVPPPVTSPAGGGAGFPQLAMQGRGLQPQGGIPLSASPGLHGASRGPGLTMPPAVQRPGAGSYSGLPQGGTLSSSSHAPAQFPPGFQYYSPWSGYGVTPGPSLSRFPYSPYPGPAFPGPGHWPPASSPNLPPPPSGGPMFATPSGSGGPSASRSPAPSPQLGQAGQVTAPSRKRRLSPTSASSPGGQPYPIASATAGPPSLLAAPLGAVSSGGSASGGVLTSRPSALAQGGAPKKARTAPVPPGQMGPPQPQTRPGDSDDEDDEA